jgi:hypothetical protein
MLKKNLRITRIKAVRSPLLIRGISGIKAIQSTSWLKIPMVNKSIHNVSAWSARIMVAVFMLCSGRMFAQTVVSTPVWRGALGGMVLCPPTSMDGAIVAVCEGGFVRSFSYDGRDLWTFRIRGKLAPFVTRGPDGISWVAEDEADGPRKLIALNRVGRKVSELVFAEPFSAPPEAGLDGRIFVPFGETVVTYSFRGQKLGESKRGEVSYNGFSPLKPPVYPHVTLTMTRAEGRRPGSEWALDIIGAAALPAYNEDGLVIVGGQNWILAAYRVEDPPLASAEPPETYKLANRIATPDSISIESITVALDRGMVGGNERAFASFLMDRSRTTATPRLPAAAIEERIAALTLLGRLGSSEYMPFLVDVLSRETVPAIKAAAARAIGTIGIDRDGRAMSALMNEALPVFPLSDSLVLNAVADAVGKLILVNGPPVYNQGSAILGAFFSQQNFPRLRNRAAYWLDQLFMP